MTAVLERPAPAIAPSGGADTGATPPDAAPGAGAPPDRGRVLTGVVLVALLAALGVLLADGATRWPALTDDEGTYVAQAWAVRELGELAHYTYWYDHPPFGWIQLAGLTAVGAPVLDAIDAGGAVVEARLLMVLPALISAALVFVVARRSGLARPTSLLAVTLFGASPLAVSSLRQVLLDNLAMPWALAALALALDPRRRLWCHGAAGVCLGVAVLSKETFLLLAPAVAVAVWQRADARLRAFSVTALAAGTALVVVAYPLLAVLKGELLPGEGHVSLLEAVQFQLGGRASTGSALLPGTESHGLVASWLAADPVLLGGGCLVAPFALLSRPLRPVAVAVAVLILTAARPGYLPHPYVVGLLPLCAVLLAGGVEQLWRVLPRRPAARVAGAVVLAVGLTAVGTSWAADHTEAAAADATAPVHDARDWVVDNVDPRARVLVDDSLFVDLADAGFEPGLGVVWFYKLGFSTNLDPSVTDALPGGHRAFDYVVSTPVLRSAVADDPEGLSEVGLALDRSEPVAAFGEGDALVEVRRLAGDGLGSGRLDAGAPPDAGGDGG